MWACKLPKHKLLETMPIASPMSYCIHQWMVEALNKRLL
jgi:hypothetical protein